MILQLYFARRFAMSFAFVFLAFLAIILLAETMDQLRRFSAVEDSFARIFMLALLHCGETIYQFLPLITIIATLAMFNGLARSSELIVTRSAGRSALRTLVPISVSVLLIGIISVAAMNPIVATTQNEYQHRARALLAIEDRTASISEQGLWLREGDQTGQSVIYAATSNANGTELFEVQFISFNIDGIPDQRIQSESAILKDGYWELGNARIWNLLEHNAAQGETREVETFKIPSNLTGDRIRDSFGEPNTISVWALPAFIQQLEGAGFSSRSHRVWLQTELSQPFMLLSMLLISAAFSMRHIRGRNSGVMMLTAILIGFGLTFLRNFARILAENGQISIELGTWVPPIAVLLLSMGVLLNMEDG